jgi:hypothetical protein
MIFKYMEILNCQKFKTMLMVVYFEMFYWHARFEIKMLWLLGDKKIDKLKQVKRV